MIQLYVFRLPWLALMTLFLSLAGRPAVRAQKLLYPVRQDDRWGFIDREGREVVPLRFRAVQPFAEGLAAARLHGRYGYIDASGDFKIPPRFDYAESFRSGYARVALDGRPYLIDRKGRVLFEHPYTGLELDSSGVVIVQTVGGQMGLADLRGQLILDTVYSSITYFSNGVAAVYHERGDTAMVAGLIDRRGRFVVPFGRYPFIEPGTDGFAQVYLPDTTGQPEWSRLAMIDSTGRLYFGSSGLPFSLVGFPLSRFSEGLISVFCQVEGVSDAASGETVDYFHGVVDRNGAFVIRDERFKFITVFSKGHAFANLEDGSWRLIDRAGRIVMEEPVLELLPDGTDGSNGFEAGYSWVRTALGLGAVDTLGRFVAPPRQMDRYAGTVLGRKEVLYFSETDDPDSPEGEPVVRWGFWELGTGQFVAPRFESIDYLRGFAGDRIAVRENGREGYIDRRGEYVWRQGRPKAGKRPLDIDFQNRRYYSASPAALYAVEDDRDMPGNPAKMIGPGQFPADSSLRLYARPDIPAPYDDAYAGLMLYVVNAGSDTALVPADQFFLDLRIQARDGRGHWRDIEYPGTSRCGDDCFQLLPLAPGQYWQFVAPVYSGETGTRLRAALRVIDGGPPPADNPQELSRFLRERTGILYSQEFDGSVNPGQFWRRADNNSSGFLKDYDH